MLQGTPGRKTLQSCSVIAVLGVPTPKRLFAVFMIQACGIRTVSVEPLAGSALNIYSISFTITFTLSLSFTLGFFGFLKKPFGFLGFYKNRSVFSHFCFQR